MRRAYLLPAILLPSATCWVAGLPTFSTKGAWRSTACSRLPSTRVRFPESSPPSPTRADPVSQSRRQAECGSERSNVHGRYPHRVHDEACHVVG